MKADEREKLGPAVSDGKPNYTSVSALSLLDSCPTKWWFRYVRGIEGEETPAMRYGTEAHARVEAYLRGNGSLDRGEKAMAPYLTTSFLPGAAIQLEQALHGGAPVKLGGIPLIGYADCIEAWGSQATVSDWKFKKDLRYAASKKELEDYKTAEGRQLLAAGRWVVNNRTLARLIRFRHVTVQTGGVDEVDGQLIPHGPFVAREVITREFSPAEIVDNWAEVSAKYEPILRRLAALAGPEGAEGNTKNCWAYGRPCPALDVCPHTKKGKKMNQNPFASSAPAPAVAEPPAMPVVPPPPAGLTLYFGGSYPINERTLTLDGFLGMLEAERGGGDIRLHKDGQFGKWKAMLSSDAKKLAHRLVGGHYLVSSEERIEVIAQALLPMATRAVGGPK